MVVRVTMTFSNNTKVHIRDSVDKEMTEQIMQKQYQEAFNSLAALGEKVVVEKCELIENI